ncbi:Mediator of RNA polymerase II transcription subunit 32 [Hibiscus syriacus]|uniref:Mediator of RNA polymerase II transcription subunit 29 n=1 Tax=Hibiscus syriacus TaxID=106335 RepID=A0A6A2Y7V6_HIBSY|nr:Mediator of RNA polymerase II transcription subunit 32 [Hibiscus syriacus]
MDKVVDCLENAYQEFVTAATTVLESKAASDDDQAAADAALESFKKKWEAFKAACDQADELVDSAKQRITANTTFPVNEDMIDIFASSVVDFDG